MDWNAISANLVECARTAGLNGLDFVPDALPNVPSFYVGEIDVELDMTFRRRQGSTRVGTDQATITCRIMVAKADDKHALRKLRDFMSTSGTESFIQAAANDRTLGGTVHDSHVKKMRGNRLFVVGEKRYYGVEIDVFVIGAS